MTNSRVVKLFEWKWRILNGWRRLIQCPGRAPSGIGQVDIRCQGHRWHRGPHLGPMTERWSS